MFAPVLARPRMDRRSILKLVKLGAAVKAVTLLPHRLTNGASVTITTALYGGTWTITVVDSLSFTLGGSTWTANTVGGRWV